MSLNPILGEHIVSYDTQQVLRLLSLLPHQNLRNIALIGSHSPLESLKHDEKIGITIATALISTSFPPEASSCSSQPWIFFQILSSPGTTPSVRVPR
jgi:hypothetical protein